MLAILLLPFSVQSVTFAAPAAPAQRLLPALGQKLNLNLGTDKNAGATVLLIDVRDMPQDQLLKTIAEVADAEWEREGNRLRLVRPQAKINRLWQDDAARRRDFIAKILARDKARLDKDGPITVALSHRLFDLQVQPKLPSQSIPITMRGALDAALALGPEALASVRAGQRIVYAPNANRSQRPLTNVLRNVALRAQQEDVTYYENLFAHKPPKYPDITFSEVDPNQREVDSAHVILARPLGTDDVVIRLRRFGPNGQPIGGSVYTVRFPERKPTVTDQPLVVPPLLREIANRTEGNDAGKAAPSPTLTATLGDPEQNEPLEIMFGGFVRQFAKGRNVIACLPDPAFEAARRTLRASNIDLPGLLSASDLETKTLDGLIAIRPIRPALAYGEAIPRAALRDLIVSLRPAGYLRVEPIVAYEQKSPGGPRPGSMDWAVLEALLGNRIAEHGDGRVEFHRFDWALLFASITQDQWRIMRERFLDPSEMTARQWTLINRVMGYSPGRISLENDTGFRVLNVGMEPTIMENMPLLSSLRANFTTEPFLALAQEGGSGSIPYRSGAHSLTRDTRFYAGTRRVFNCSLRIASGTISVSGTNSSPVYDVTIRSGEQPVPFERLSPEIRSHFFPNPLPK
jgi:hypothetical protein